VIKINKVFPGIEKGCPDGGTSQQPEEE